jgi:hypothetical protein
MTTYNDNLLAARFAALAPEPEPGDWDDVRQAESLAACRLAGSHAPSSGSSCRRKACAVVTASAFAVRAFVWTRLHRPPGATPARRRTELVLH